MIFFRSFLGAFSRRISKKKNKENSQKKNNKLLQRLSRYSPRPLFLPITPMTNTRHSLYNLFTLPNKKQKNRIVSIGTMWRISEFKQELKWNFWFNRSKLEYYKTKTRTRPVKSDEILQLNSYSISKFTQVRLKVPPPPKLSRIW